MIDIPIENIGDAEIISRHTYAGMYDGESLMWQGGVFEFRSARDCRESVVWRKYADAPESVHQIACRQEDWRRSKYRGFISANVGDVRAVRTKSEHILQVKHKPDEKIHHAEISIHPLEGATKPIKLEIRLLLKRRFGPTETHSCD